MHTIIVNRHTLCFTGSASETDFTCWSQTSWQDQPPGVLYRIYPAISKGLRMRSQAKNYEANETHLKMYHPARLWLKIRRTASMAGRNTIETAFILYYTSTAKETPAWCKGVIYGALGYFISLIDGIPDLTPLLGYSDDFTVMAAAVATLTQYITPEIKQKAKGRIDDIFGHENQS